MSPVVIRGATPIVLVAPHGGRRDPVARPWGSAPLKMNDLHTASLARELAAALDASALVNETLDRNDVDLNRLSAAHDHAPQFLATLGELVRGVVARHGRATVLVVHGWNVVEPRLDVGLGCRAGNDQFAVDGSAAVSPAFAAGGVAALAGACATRGIHATIGARYPARAAENLVQLFTARHRDDRRRLVRDVAALAPRCDALQLELGIPLRWEGAWRRRFREACVAALPALAAAGDPAAARPYVVAPPARRPSARRRGVEIAGPGFAALAGIDAAGGRLLLFRPDGGLLLFTGERAGHEGAEHVGGLGLSGGDDTLAMRFAGPLARFPDSAPFLDLEAGLARATVLDDVRLGLDFVAVDAGDDVAVGRVRGTLAIGGDAQPIDAHAFVAHDGATTPWPRLRLALRLGERAALALTLGTGDGRVAGFVWDGVRRRSVTGATARLGSPDRPIAGLAVDVRTEDGAGLRIEPDPVHLLPVVRGGTSPAVRVLYAACRLAGGTHPAGWCELGGY